MAKPKQGELRVWWCPQVPGSQLFIPVENLREAHLVLDTLAIYDAFQYANNVKGDYCNAGGLQVYEEQEWVEWADEETGEEIREYSERVFKPIFSNRMTQKLWQCVRLKSDYKGA